MVMVIEITIVIPIMMAVMRTDLMVIIVITTIMISDYHDNDYNGSGI